MATYDIKIQAQDNTGRTLQGIDRKLSSVEKNASKVTNTMRGAVAAVAAFAAGSVVRGIVDQYRAYEKYQVVLSTYLGSQQAANKELLRLQKLANSLPQDLNDITEAFVLFTSRGLDTSSKALKAFSNIATANGKSMTQLGEAVADALTGEFERLKEFGIKVSKENDKFVADIGNGQSIIAASSQELVNKLQALGEEGGKFGKAAANNSNTLDQAISNLNGQMFAASVTIGSKLKPAIKGVVDELSNWIAANDKLIGQLATNIGQGLVTTFNSLSKSMKFLAANFEAIKNAALFLIFTRLAGSLTNIIVKMSSAIKASQGLGAMFKTMGNSIGKSILKIPLLGGSLRALGTVATRLLPLLLNPWGLVAAAIAVVAGSLFYLATDGFSKVGTTATNMGEILTAVWDLVAQSATRFVNWVSTGVKGLYTSIVGWFKAIPGEIASAWNSAGVGTAAFIVKIKSWFLSTYNTIRKQVGKWMEPLSKAFTKVMTVVKTGLNWVINTYIKTFKQIKNIIYQLPSFFVSAFKGILTLMSDFGNSIVEKFTNVGSAISKALTGDFTGAMAEMGKESAYNFTDSWAKNIGNLEITMLDLDGTMEIDRIGGAIAAIGTTAESVMTSIGSISSSTWTGIKEGALLASTAVNDFGLSIYDATVTGPLKVLEDQILANRAAAIAAAAATKLYNEQNEIADAKLISLATSVKAASVAVEQSIAPLSGYAKFWKELNDSVSSIITTQGYEQKALEAINKEFEAGRMSLERYALAKKELGVTSAQLTKTFAQELVILKARIGADIEQAALNVKLLSSMQELYGIESEQYKLAVQMLGITSEKTKVDKEKLTVSEQLIKQYGDENIKLKQLYNALANVDSISKKTGRSVKYLTKEITDQIDAIESHKDKATSIAGIIADTWSEMGDNMAAGIAKGIMAGEGMFNSFSGFLKNFANTVITQIIQKMLVQPMINQMTQFGSSLMGGLMGGGGAGASGGGGFDIMSLFGGGGFDLMGMFGGISSWFSGLFSGFFANGGNVPAGKFGIAGEAGPEIVTGPASVISNSDSFGGQVNSGEALTINFNINAIDQATGAQFIIEHKKEITGIIQGAYNKRGKTGIYN